MFGEGGKQLEEFYEQLPLGVTIENYAPVKKRVDVLREQGVHDLAAYFAEHPEERDELIQSVEVLGANSSMLNMYRVDSFQAYLDMYEDVEDWENAGWVDSYAQIIVDLANGPTCFGEYSDLAADGTPIHVSFVSWIMKGYEDDWSRVINTHDDVTLRKQSERRIRESEARMKALFDNASEGMFFKDKLGRYELVNKTFANRIGYDDVSEVIGKTAYDLYPEEDAKRYRLDDLACMDSREISSKELDIPLPNGSEIIQFAIKFPIISEDDEVVGTGGIDVDITERKQLERMKNEFVSTVSHELRTPLTSIRGALGLLMESTLGALPDKANTMLEIAFNNTNRLINLVNDVLDMEKIASDGMEYDFRQLDIAALVEDSLEADHDFVAEHGDRKIVTRIDKSIMVHGDQARLSQVFANLLSNAVKFSPEGGEIVVSVCAEVNCVRVSVADEGPGIPNEFRDHIFERFTQVDSSDSRQKGGTGLGLNISKSIIEAHDGEIGFVSQVGAGSTFYFELPTVS